MIIARIKTDPHAAEKQGATYWLGIHKKNAKPATQYDYIILGNSGITKKSINVLANYIGATRKHMAEDIFDISIKTMERKTAATKLDKKLSSHAIEIAKVVHHAYEIFQDEGTMKLWINRENKALHNKKPIQLFDTLTGLNMVNDILGRIEEGVYS
jgi:putative toxin-antitoxin system antitoxin component (TIGR02293 family)